MWKQVNCLGFLGEIFFYLVSLETLRTFLKMYFSGDLFSKSYLSSFSLSCVCNLRTGEVSHIIFRVPYLITFSHFLLFFSGFFLWCVKPGEKEILLKKNHNSLGFTLERVGRHFQEECFCLVSHMIFFFPLHVFTDGKKILRNLERTSWPKKLSFTSSRVVNTGEKTIYITRKHLFSSFSPQGFCRRRIFN